MFNEFLREGAFLAEAPFLRSFGAFHHFPDLYAKLRTALIANHPYGELF